MNDVKRVDDVNPMRHVDLNFPESMCQNTWIVYFHQYYLIWIIICLQVWLVILVVLFPKRFIFIFLLPKPKKVDAKPEKFTTYEDLEKYRVNDDVKIIMSSEMMHKYSCLVFGVQQ